MPYHLKIITYIMSHGKYITMSFKFFKWYDKIYAVKYNKIKNLPLNISYLF
jgi:hypothetical protein